MKIFLLPDLGEGLAEAEIHEWYIKPGDEIEIDQPMVSMETAKAVVDVPAPYAGTITKLFGKPGDIIQTATPLVGFEEDNQESNHSKSSATVVGSITVGKTTIKESAAGITVQSYVSDAIKATPAVRVMAKQLNINLTTITGTGPNGQITSLDVKNAYDCMHSLQKRFSDAEFKPLHGVRRSMAHAMSQAHQQVAPVTVMDDADIDHWEKGVDITVHTLRALQYACSKEPALNAWYDGSKLTHALHTSISVGLAMDTDDGLFVPVLKDIATQSDKELREKIDKIKIDVRERRISPEDLHGATITLSNVGVFAARYTTPIVVPPMVAIIAMGKIRNDAIVVDGKVVAHRILPLSLTFDHRIVSGGEATRFLGAMVEKLQERESR